jgi:hypothetical protein
VAYATGEKADGVEATVSYADVWMEGAFTAQEKRELAVAAATESVLFKTREVTGHGMDRLKPFGFSATDWPGVHELFMFRSNGIVTYRDEFVYATSHGTISQRIQNWLAHPIEQARREFGESAMNKVGPACATAFDAAAIERVSYRPLDVRWLYNRQRYVDRPRPELQEAWGDENVALFALGGGTGGGPAVWCHGLKPDQHAFRGSYGGWVFPFRHHAGEGVGHFLAPTLMPGLSAAYGQDIDPQAAFDAILALLSASSYTIRFAHDLEDDFPHVPFPADPELFRRVVNIGKRIRELQTFADSAGPEFRNARLAGNASGTVIDVPTPRLAFAAEAGLGEVALLSDRSLRISVVSEAIWNFRVSGYPVLYRWLRARNGEPINAALQRGILDTVWRIEELLHLFGQADGLLSETLQATLTRAQVGLPRHEVAEQLEEEEADGTA